MQVEINGFMDNLVNALDEVNASAAKPDVEFGAFANWDSLAALATIVMINTEYGIEVTGTELKSCTTPKDLFTIVHNKMN